jgi:tetratricopeptide (TPR) repeat protein
LRGNLNEAIAAFTSANETARAIGYTLGAGATLEAIGASRVEQGDLEAGLRDLRAGAAQIESAGSRPNLVDALCDVANAYSLQRSPEALATAERALAIARDLALPERIGLALQSLGRARLALGDQGGARAALEESRSLLVPGSHELARTLALLGGIYMQDDARRDEGLEMLAQARETFTKLGAMLDLRRMERAVSAT